MPRQTFDIKEFKYGVISSLDEEDISPESASDSLNVDGDVGEGILRGIPSDTEFLVDSDGDASVDDSIGNIRLGEFIENDGTYYLIYHDTSDDKIKSINDFNSTRTISELVTSDVSNEVTMVANNKEVHIGTGNSLANLPKWIGFTRGYVFGNITDHFVGSGLDDMTGDISAATNTEVCVFEVEIENASTTPDTYRWRKNGGSYTTGFITAATPIELLDGVTITFTNENGHTNGDKWYIVVRNNTALTVENAKISRSTDASTYNEIGISTSTSGSGAANFTDGAAYKYKVSFIYDGYQESPLSVDEDTEVISGTVESIVVTLTARFAISQAYNWNQRITGVNLYRSESPDGTTAGYGLYRLVASFDMTEFSTASSTNLTLTYTDYNTSGATYTENTGMPESITDSGMNYCLSTKGNGYHFIGKCYKAQIPDADRYVFRSKYLRYDMFDYTSDFVILPEPITALKFYEGKLYAFSLNRMYRINPDGLYIEDIYEDAGAQGQRAVHTNDYGMFFGNFINAWMYNNSGLLRIGDAIRHSASGGKSWQTFYNNTLTDLIVTSDGKKGYVLFINERNSSGAKIFAWAYHPTKRRWDAFSFGNYTSSATAGVFKDKDGAVYLSIGSNTYKLMRPSVSTYTQAWEWYSQELTFGETQQNKSITMIKVDSTGTVSITYGLDGATPSTSGTSGALINVYNKSIRIKLNASAVTSGTSYTNYVDSMEIIYRPLVGAR